MLEFFWFPKSKDEPYWKPELQSFAYLIQTKTTTRPEQQQYYPLQNWLTHVQSFCQI